jgi:hypothetical protein
MLPAIKLRLIRTLSEARRWTRLRLFDRPALMRPFAA